MHADVIPFDPMTTLTVPPAGGYQHLPVLVSEVLGCVPEGAALLADCTVGGGGHAEALLRAFPQAELFGCDRDARAIEAAGARLAEFSARILLKRIPFSQLPHHVLAGSLDFLLADLGVSSHHLDDAGRGFSFTRDGPLDMRMDPESGAPSAADLVNESPRETLLEWLRGYGEERFAPRIVDALLAARGEAPIGTTGELARIVAGAVPAKFHRKGFHPATRVFQALRIAVNDELGDLDRLLDKALYLLKPGGRLAVISFHSLEDRRVKERFAGWEKPCTCPPSMPACVCGRVSLGRRVTRKPIMASPEEQADNPRCRSSRLRVFELGREIVPGSLEEARP